MKGILHSLRGIRAVDVLGLVTVCVFFTCPIYTNGEHLPFQIAWIVPCFLPIYCAIRGFGETGVAKLKTPLILPLTADAVSLSVWRQLTLLLPFSFAAGFLFWWWFAGVESGWIFAYVAGVGVSGIASGVFSLRHFAMPSKDSIPPEELIVRPMLMLIVFALGGQSLAFRSAPTSTLIPLLSAFTLFSAISIFWSYKSHKESFYNFLESAPIEILSESNAHQPPRSHRGIEFLSWAHGACRVEPSDPLVREVLLWLAILFIARTVFHLEGIDVTAIYSGSIVSIPAFLACISLRPSRFFHPGAFRAIALLPCSRWALVKIDLGARLVLAVGAVTLMFPVFLLLDGWDYVARTYPQIPTLVAIYYLFLSIYYLYRKEPVIRLFLIVPLAFCTSLLVFGYELNGLDSLRTPAGFALLTGSGFTLGAFLHGIGLKRERKRVER